MTGSKSAPTKTILITGCSSGIGRDAALTMKARGWQVLATCRKEDDCRKLTQMGLTSFVLDYEDEGSIERGFQTAMNMTGGRLDVLFNNGAYAIPGAVEDLPTAALRQIFEANFFGWHHLTRLAVKVMRDQGHGRLIQNSSVLGFAALRFRGAYNATKFALEGLSDTLRLELKDSEIKVILVEPGPIRTRIRQNSYPHFQRWIDWQSSVLRPTYTDKVIPRLTAPDDSPPDLFELQPDAISMAVIDACESTHPKLRYRITRVTQIAWVLKRLLPGKVLDRILVRL